MEPRRGQSNEMSCLRRILGVSRLDKIRNSHIKQSLNRVMLCLLLYNDVRRFDLYQGTHDQNGCTGVLKMDVTLYFNHALCTGLNNVNVWYIVNCDHTIFDGSICICMCICIFFFLCLIIFF